MRKTRTGLLLFCLLVGVAALASTGGSISGTVRDSSDAAVPGAHVTIRNVDTAFTQTVDSNDLGGYFFLTLPVGRYELTVHAAGFEAYQQTGITLNTADQLRFDVALKVGQVTQEVQVTTSAVHVETASTQLGDVIKGSAMEALPLNGRQFTDLLGLQPGVAPEMSTQTATFGNFFGTTETGNISVSGQRETANGFLINGSNVDNSLNNGTTVVPNLDSIAEFRILTGNFDAEYGNYSGGLITVVTKSGSNGFHGDGFDFLRNTSLDSRGFFDNTRNTFQQNQFGGTVGGPIRRDKVFFFADYQGTRNNIGQATGQVPVPSPAERQGDFSAIADSALTGTVGGAYWAGVLSNELGYPVTNGENYYTPGCTSSATCVFPNGVIPTAAFSAPAKALLQYVPTPNVGSLFVSGANVVHTRDDLGSGRVDFNTQGLGMISAYYFIDNNFILTPFGANNTPGFPSENGGRSQLYTLGDTKNLGTSALNDFHVSYNRYVYHNNKPLKGFGSLSSFGFNENQPGGIVDAAGALEGVPNINFNSFSIGMPAVNYNRYENTYSVLDNFSKVFGNHTTKFGAQYVFNELYEPMPLVASNGIMIFGGTETGSDFADFLIGAPTEFLEEGGFNVDNRRNYAGFYAQDSWRVRSNFTVNYGLRWDVFQPWYEKHDQASTFALGVQSTVQPNAPLGYVFPGDRVPGYGTIPNTIARTGLHDFAPRIGFAWSPSGGNALGRFLGGPDKLSVRAGFGIYYNNIEGAEELDETGLAPFDVFYEAPEPPLFASPYTNRVDGAIHQPFPYSTQNFNWSLALPLSGYLVVPINQRVPYTETYNLTVQRQLGSGTLLSVGYLGNQSHHLLTQLSNNPGDPSLCLSLSQPSEVAPGTPTCGPFLENLVYTRPDGTTVNGTRAPFGGNYGDNVYFATVANSDYNALQLSLRHTSGRASFFAGYTYSKSLDDSSNLQDKFPNPLDMNLSKGLSSFDITHNFVISYTYLLPFDTLARNRWPRLTSGWKVVGITHFATGFPIIMYEEDDHSLLGNSGGTDTPNFQGGNLNFINPRQANAENGVPFFNTSLFSPSAIGLEGTANKAFFHGPGTNNFDMALQKDLKLKERTSLEFRGEFFNIFNHAQFINPSGNITAGSSVFGIINSAGPGRIGQLAVKLLF